MGNSGKLEDNKTVQWSIVVKTLVFFDYNTHFVLILECFFSIFLKIRITHSHSNCPKFEALNRKSWSLRTIAVTHLRSPS